MHTDNSDFENEYNSNDFNGDTNQDIDENFYGYEETEPVNNNSKNKSGKSKKIIIIIVVILLLLLCIGGLIFFLVKNNNGNGPQGGETPVLTPSITLSESSFELKIGSSKKITYTVENYNGNISVTWNSSNKSIATVDKNGTVKGIKKGTATITATYIIDGKEYTKTCLVTVKNADGGGTTQSVDKTKPTLSYTITSGKENTWVNNDVKIKVTARDNSGSVTVKYTTNCNSDCKYTTISNGVINISKSGSSVIRIVATDKAGNSTEKKVTVMIDKTKPTCSLAVSEAGVLSSKYNDTGSNISYYGFDPSYSGTSSNSQNLTKADTYTYYVKDKAGNTNTCSLVVKTKTQYKYQDCTSCKMCYAAGCEKGYWKAAGTTTYESLCTTTFPKVVGDNKYINCTVTSASSGGRCNFSCSYSKWQCAKYNNSCDKCGGCDSWGDESGWTDNISESASRKITNTRVVYYSD